MFPKSHEHDACQILQQAEKPRFSEICTSKSFKIPFRKTTLASHKIKYLQKIAYYSVVKQ